MLETLAKEEEEEEEALALRHVFHDLGEAEDEDAPPPLKPPQTDEGTFGSKGALARVIKQVQETGGEAMDLASIQHQQARSSRDAAAPEVKSSAKAKEASKKDFRNRFFTKVDRLSFIDAAEPNFPKRFEAIAAAKAKAGPRRRPGGGSSLARWMDPGDDAASVVQDP